MERKASKGEAEWRDEHNKDVLGRIKLRPSIRPLGGFAASKTELRRLMDEEKAAEQAEKEENSGLGYI